MSAVTNQQAEEVYGQLAGHAAMKIVEAVQNGEQWALDALAEYQRTGIAPTVKIDSLEKMADV